MAEMLRTQAVSEGAGNVLHALDAAERSVMEEEGGERRERKWCQRFHSKKEGEGPRERWRRVEELTREFEEVAGMYGRIIISELGLPGEQKTVKAASVGGVAGGDKFIVEDILFKFSKDVELAPGMWLYGGSHGANVVAAQKASGNELRALEAVHDAGTELRVPLMTVVDFAGWRLTAQALVPIDGESLVYGSGDAGWKVADGRGCGAELVGEVEKIARVHSLALHSVREVSSGEEKELWTAADV